MLENLQDMLSSPLFWGSFLALTVVSYGLYLVAWLFESRIPLVDTPVWKDQSKAFMPGDAGLSLLVAVGIWHYGQVEIGWQQSVLTALFALGIAVVTFVIARRFLYTSNDYTREAWNSPSKLYHDYVMYVLFCWLAVWVCIPAYLFTDWTGNLLTKLVGVFGLSLWVAGNAWDFTHDEVPNPRQHPTIYKPIWK